MNANYVLVLSYLVLRVVFASPSEFCFQFLVPFVYLSLISVFVSPAMSPRLSGLAMSCLSSWRVIVLLSQFSHFLFYFDSPMCYVWYVKFCFPCFFS